MFISSIHNTINIARLWFYKNKKYIELSVHYFTMYISILFTNGNLYISYKYYDLIRNVLSLKIHFAKLASK